MEGLQSPDKLTRRALFKIQNNALHLLSNKEWDAAMNRQFYEQQQQANLAGSNAARYDVEHGLNTPASQAFYQQQQQLMNERAMARPGATANQLLQQPAPAPAPTVAAPPSIRNVPGPGEMTVVGGQEIAGRGYKPGANTPAAGYGYVGGPNPYGGNTYFNVGPDGMTVGSKPILGPSGGATPVQAVQPQATPEYLMPSSAEKAPSQIEQMLAGEPLGIGAMLSNIPKQAQAAPQNQSFMELSGEQRQQKFLSAIGAPIKAAGQFLNPSNWQMTNNSFAVFNPKTSVSPQSYPISSLNIMAGLKPAQTQAPNLTGGMAPSQPVQPAQTQGDVQVYQQPQNEAITSVSQLYQGGATPQQPAAPQAPQAPQAAPQAPAQQLQTPATPYYPQPPKPPQLPAYAPPGAPGSATRAMSEAAYAKSYKAMSDVAMDTYNAQLKSYTANVNAQSKAARDAVHIELQKLNIDEKKSKLILNEAERKFAESGGSMAVVDIKGQPHIVYQSQYGHYNVKKLNEQKQPTNVFAQGVTEKGEPIGIYQDTGSGKQFQIPADAMFLQQAMGGMGAAPAGAAPKAQAAGQKLSKDQAAAILAEAGGDKAKARKLATDRGFSF